MIIDDMKVDQEKHNNNSSQLNDNENQNHLIIFMGKFLDDVKQRHIKTEYRAKEKGNNMQK